MSRRPKTDWESEALTRLVLDGRTVHTICPTQKQASELFAACDRWVNTRTGEEFKVEAKPAGPARTWRFGSLD